MNSTIPTKTDVLICGAGPAGSLLASLLARQGVDVLLVEKQATFERSFRGETIAGQSVRSLFELGFGPALQAHGYLEQTGITMIENGQRLFSIDYRAFDTPYLPVDLPQPALINILVEDAGRHPRFRFLPATNVTELVFDGGAVVGAMVKPRGGEPVAVASRLLIGADGRFSNVRKLSGLSFTQKDMPRDFLWFKLPRPEGWGSQGRLAIRADRNLVVLPTYPDLLRVGYNLPKGGLAEMRAAGLSTFISAIAALDAQLGALAQDHVRSWSDTSFLNIFTATMERWSRDGLLLIGDAAHTASPILGQGVNLALQDAVAAAVVIGEQLAASPSSGPLPARAFDDLVAMRRKHTEKVMALQTRQEASLAIRSHAGAAVRRVRMRALDRFPRKHQMLERALNPPSSALEATLMRDPLLVEAKRFVHLHANHMGLSEAQLNRVLGGITMLSGSGRATWVGELTALADADGLSASRRADLLNLARFPYADNDAKLAAGRRAAAVVAEDLAARGTGRRLVAETADGAVPFLFRAAGRPDAPLVIVVGGIVSLKEQWARFLDLAPRLGCGVAVVDFPGVGENPIRYTREAGSLFAAIMDATFATRTLVLAPSFGGHLALSAAVDEPRIARIVTIDAPLSEFFLQADSVDAMPAVTREALRRCCGSDSAGLAGHLAGLALHEAELARIEAVVDFVVSAHDEVVPGTDWQGAGSHLRRARFTLFDDVHGAPAHLRHTRLIVLKAVLELAGRRKRARAVGALIAIAGRSARLTRPAVPLPGDHRTPIIEGARP